MRRVRSNVKKGIDTCTNTSSEHTYALQYQSPSLLGLPDSEQREHHEYRSCYRDAVTDNGDCSVTAHAKVMCGNTHAMSGVPDNRKQHTKCNDPAERILHESQQSLVT